MGHLHILTSDPAAHRKLWIEVLGGVPVKAGPIELAKFPGVLVAFRQGAPSAGTEGSVVDHLGFLVRDLASTKNKLAHAGVPIVREAPETRQFFALFPDKVKVEFTEDATLQTPIRHHHVHFASQRLEEMRAWYARALGAIPGMRGRFKAADLPGVNLSWNSAEKPPAPTKGRSLDHIGFEVQNLRVFAKKLEALGVQFEVPPTWRPELGLTVAFFTDPFGAYVELTEGLSSL
jgi:catechol 2,3-dioxygenase-like lactoylglutathione lyase family enzyme